jgi:hypothetical protein
MIQTAEELVGARSWVAPSATDSLRARLMLVSNLGRAAVVAVIAGLVLSGRAELRHLYLLAAIYGVVDVFFYPALGTIVPMIVPERLPAAMDRMVQA